jgi:uncharacterized repeat protein (TIGR02543 family)
LYAKWIQVFTVTFNANGDNVINLPSSIGVKSGDLVNKPADPSRYSYEFDGWYREASGTNEWNFITDTVTSDTNLYAKWNPVLVTSIELNETTLSMVVNSSGTLLYIKTVLPVDATNKNVTWSSDNPSVVTVDSVTGLVTAVSAGTAIITATTVDGSNKTANCAITVTNEEIAVTGVSINKTSISLAIGKTETLIPTVTPTNATNKNVTWSSDKTSVATVGVETGIVTAIGAGTATITVTTADGSYKATCTVTVNTAVISIKVEDIENLTPDIIGGTSISRSGNGTIRLEAPTGYDKYEWSIEGVDINAGKISLSDDHLANSVTVRADNIEYNSRGKHAVYLIVWKNNVPYSKTIWITIEE